MALVDARPVASPSTDPPARTRSRGWIVGVIVLALISGAVTVGPAAAARARAAADVAAHTALVTSAQAGLDRAVARLGEVEVGARADGDLPGAPSLEAANASGDSPTPSVRTTLVRSTSDVVVAYVVVRSNGYASAVVEKHTTSASASGFASLICAFGDVGGMASDCADLLPEGVAPLG
jgi:hypothetical protein